MPCHQAHGSGQGQERPELAAPHSASRKDRKGQRSKKRQRSVEDREGGLSSIDCIKRVSLEMLPARDENRAFDMIQIRTRQQVTSGQEREKG